MINYLDRFSEWWYGNRGTVYAIASVIIVIVSVLAVVQLGINDINRHDTDRWELTRQTAKKCLDEGHRWIQIGPEQWDCYKGPQ